MYICMCEKMKLSLGKGARREKKEGGGFKRKRIRKQMREGPGDRSNVKRNAFKRFMKITKKKKMERSKKGKQKTYMLVEKKTKRLR